MFEPAPEALESLVPLGAHFDGLIEGRGPTRIDGSVEGEVIVRDSLRIGADARVRARIHAREVVIDGSVEGEIQAPGRIELRATAQVSANLYTGCFVLADGARFEGHCRTVPPSDSPLEAPKAPDSNSAPRIP